MAEADKPTKAGERWRLVWLYGGSVTLLVFLILTRPQREDASTLQVRWFRHEREESVVHFTTKRERATVLSTK